MNHPDDHTALAPDWNYDQAPATKEPDILDQVSDEIRAEVDSYGTPEPLPTRIEVNVQPDQMARIALRRFGTDGIRNATIGQIQLAVREHLAELMTWDPASPDDVRAAENRIAELQTAGWPT